MWILTLPTDQNSIKLKPILLKVPSSRNEIPFWKKLIKTSTTLKYSSKILLLFHNESLGIIKSRMTTYLPQLNTIFDSNPYQFKRQNLPFQSSKLKQYSQSKPNLSFPKYVILKNYSIIISNLSLHSTYLIARKLKNIDSLKLHCR